ncbi:exodeoxyribonuclease VII large subunit [Halorhodospira halochloris]|uniref:Exodeoxyribonuclease 7 large subunit n=1 Tax=Halorhodospira halochloris TaxID=1052 RepID=A0A0X8XCK4_HALHR|nr:exodeoxyribonuclease VII large subunit [Halorhodospira halochloris]MBK1652589.1 exodeoxyribonuclease VII large subunit [Halorhodospira halochloris]BAU58179.1 exodeoxyribonuclease VII large subunit [Halorhodospira halochloris]
MSEPEQNLYTPSQLNQEVRGMLETVLPGIWVEGEISNLARPASGHLYFSLKDSDAQVRCALFRARASRANFRPENGDQVRVKAKASLYPPRGDFQLIVEHLEEAGEGALRRAFEQLKQRLEAEGLFAADKKRQLPSFPRRIGVITSPSGAAIRDVLSVLERRFKALPVIVYPVAVQGDGAAGQIVRMLEIAEQRNEVDALILTRGGGSLEDLWPFNEEAVARAIRACPIPLISAVGHETDVTIADFAADLRAPTPSAAAETLSIDTAAYLERIGTLHRRLTAAEHRLRNSRQERLDQLERRLACQHPGRKLRDRAQRLDELESRLRRLVLATISNHRQKINTAEQRLFSASPKRRIDDSRRQIQQQLQLLQQGMRSRLNDSRQRLAATTRALQAVSPLATLERGYAVAQHPDGKVIRQAQELKIGDTIYTRLATGALDCTVERIYQQHTDTTSS